MLKCCLTNIFEIDGMYHLNMNIVYFNGLPIILVKRCGKEILAVVLCTIYRSFKQHINVLFCFVFSLSNMYLIICKENYFLNFRYEVLNDRHDDIV